MTPPGETSAPATPRLRALYGALWRYAQGRRGLLLAALALLVCAESVRLAVPWFTGRALDALQRQGVEGMGPAGRELLMVFVAIVIGWSLHAPARMLERNVALHVRSAFNLTLLQRLMRAPLAWHLQHHSAETAHRVSQSSQALHGFAESQYVYVQNVMRLVGPLLALWLISPWVGAAAVLGFGLLGAFSLAVDRVLIRLSAQHNDGERRHQAAWQDTLAHVLTVFALRRMDGARRLIMDRLDALYVPLRRMVVLNEAKWAGVDVVSALLWCGLVALYAVLASRGLAGAGAGTGVALGSLYMVYEYARRAEEVMSVMASDFSVMAGQQAHFASADPLLQAPQDSRDITLRTSAWQVLAFDAVAHGRDAVGLVGGAGAGRLNLRLQRGLRYALVGRSGAGKSTLLRLLAGLDGVAAGRVTLDGRAVDPGQLRREATLVPQESQLFVGTLAENLSLGQSASGGAVSSALQAACASDFVHELPQGLDTVVAEGGGNWSGGQRQRLALARGLLAADGSSLVLFDEPTSGLDEPTEALALARVLAHVGGACSVVTLHRLSLLGLFDQVIVMDDGQIIDIGRADEVQARCPAFRALLAAPAEAAPLAA